MTYSLHVTDITKNVITGTHNFPKHLGVYKYCRQKYVQAKSYTIVVVMSRRHIYDRKKTTSTNQTDEMEEDATTGMINIWKNLKNNVFKWKICIYINVTNAT